MAIVQHDPLARMRAYVSEKPEQLKQQLNAWTSKQPAWVDGVVTGLTGSLQVRGGPAVGVLCCCRVKRGRRCSWLLVAVTGAGGPDAVASTRCDAAAPAGANRTLYVLALPPKAVLLSLSCLAAGRLSGRAAAGMPLLKLPLLQLPTASAPDLHLQGAFLGVLMGSVGKMNVDAAAASAYGRLSVCCRAACWTALLLPAALIGLLSCCLLPWPGWRGMPDVAAAACGRTAC